MTRALVNSGACGADLVAQTVAGALGLRRRIILPFDRQRFRQTSVVDRPGNWGPIYDRLVQDLDAAGDVITLADTGDDTESYALTNMAILDHARDIGATLRRDVLAVLVWEGSSRGPDDLTAAFGHVARKRGVRLVEISTR